VPPFLGSFEVLDADGELRATLRRDGEGLRVLLMNYALEDAEGRPIYRIRQPEARPGIHLGGAFSLVRPDGTPEGDLRMSPGLGHSTYSLDRPGRVPITAVRSGLVWKGFEIQQGSRSIAQVRADWTTRPPALSLDFQGPLGESAPRALLVAFLGFVALH
jgi:hypothetical protein